ncbi:MarR family transcriptional regulator [Robertmurraya yapensis]|uniref:MarR family transcriptional regulator n=1 Tax=Bacillus yapensis TaxID=2492960 RepID=A0A3S0I973_9BACI|nr:winged helix DNA-binding protein [Bacillus yapensis]RTR28166.1 MarR family transcriptional regulator [Bacillus yapensis]TKS94409.1 MarR family transcriptional regulator [Bacillus yapensis]
MNQINNSKPAETFRYLILATERQGRSIFKETFKKIGVTGAQAEVLKVLQENEPLSLKELGAMLICETESPSRLINRLVTTGWVQKETSEKDSRFVNLSLSKEGKEKVLQITKIEDSLYKMLEQSVPIEILENLNMQLSNLLSEQPISHTLRLRGIIK